MAVVLDERDLVDPGDVSDGIEGVGVRMVGAFDVAEHGDCEVEAHAAVLRAHRRACVIPIE